ncbi:SDR family oxidoreductase [Sulfitobacter aestuariivivens]|uniref:SDR family oxidoreductase n=1 Tax=Sulfitobacter aestuariivivens TaxID=2766981 RepID=A0A927HFV2_9RHOB|nr:SDR family oxidoreductase [Sulfitobacter aestuariivivens]MBD3665321.1 SDR family oxidoreductase [Sulfitobacter aestuariivivens]
MTDPIQPPPKKNPLNRSWVSTIPPAARSRAALGLTAAAAEGRFMLQVCADCGATQYPPRDACHKCLSIDLPWQDIIPTGELLAETTIRATTDIYFRDRLPWRAGTVRLDAGPPMICHIHGDVKPYARVRLINRLDRSGQGVILALPEKDTPNMADDPHLRAISSDPSHRRVLIVDGRNPNTPDFAKALKDAGAAMILIGLSEDWLPFQGRKALEDVGAQIIPLDVTDTKSLQRLAGEFGGKIDILINNARYIRPGGVIDRTDTNLAARELEVNALGLMRLAQALGPAMCSRTADGTNSAVAWVNILSAWALANEPSFGSFAASQAAALSLSQSLRAEFRASGLRLMNVFVGPTDDEWHQPLPPPKVTPAAIARDVVRGLHGGFEDVFCGDVAKDLNERFRRNPKVLEREMTGGGV